MHQLGYLALLAKSAETKQNITYEGAHIKV